MVGFNRRFAPLLGQDAVASSASRATRPTRYLVNAGPLAADSWYPNEELEGSRFTGEGGHFIDTLSWWVGSLPAEVYALGGPEKGDVHATRALRERLDRHDQLHHRRQLALSRRRRSTPPGAGRSARLDNFRKATVWTGRKENATKARGGQDKGQRAELEKFAEACLTGGPMPISVESLVATTRATIAVGESLLSGRPERV